MFIHPEWSLFRPITWQFPEWRMTGSSSFRYSEDNSVINYELTVPDNIEDGKIDVELKDGVLYITLPKVKVVEQPPEQTGKIKVKRG